MQKGVVSVEANLIEKSAKMRAEKKVTYREDTTASTSEPKYDDLAKNMNRLERMMEKMVVQVNNHNTNQSQKKNQNFRRNIHPNRQRDSDQQIIPPFQENFLDEDEGIIEESEGTTINMVEVYNQDHTFSMEDN